MPSRDERKRRREIVQRINDEKKAEEEASMPLSKDALAALLQYLDGMVFEKKPDGSLSCSCDHTFRYTKQFLSPLGFWSEQIPEWLSQYGGFCDCEVVFNVGNAWADRL